jgi:hypothetical protein
LHVVVEAAAAVAPAVEHPAPQRNRRRETVFVKATAAVPCMSSLKQQQQQRSRHLLSPLQAT